MERDSKTRIKKDGTPNTQLELSRTKLTVGQVMVKLQEQLIKCRLHVGRYKWSNYNRQLDYIMHDPNTTRTIMTDFGATLDLCAAEKDNSSVNNHAVVCIFFVLSNWRKVNYVRTDTSEWDEMITNECDKWIVFGDTMAKGKKNDHVFHNACIAHLISYYDKEREEQGKGKIATNIVWTDGCPTQYKCRQNFVHVAMSGKSNGSRIVHKFAEKYCFKGSWDATGKLVKHTIMKNELKYDRCANANDCYNKLKRDLSSNGLNKKRNQNWIEWENNGNEKLIQKTPLTTNRTFIGLGTESEEEYNRLQTTGENHIIYTNRLSIPDMRAVAGTQKIFQISGDVDPISLEKYTLVTATLPCSCPPCRINPTNIDTCIYKGDRDLKKIVVSKLEENNNDSDIHGLAKLTVAALKDELAARDLSKKGNKPELRARLEEYLNL